MSDIRTRRTIRNNMTMRAHLIAEGRVQGVCYRMYAREEAQRLGITGWVQNLSNGNVEIVAEGDDANLAEFVNWCRKGPSYAHVSKLSEDFSEQPTGEFETFQVVYF